MNRYYIELARSCLEKAQDSIRNSHDYMAHSGGLDKEIRRLNKSMNALRNLEDILGHFLENKDYLDKE